MFGAGERLENIRRVRMWTQARLAREAGVSPTTVSGIETGKIARPHLGTLGKAGSGFGRGARRTPRFARDPRAARSGAYVAGMSERDRGRGVRERA